MIHNRLAAVGYQAGYSRPFQYKTSAMKTMLLLTDFSENAFRAAQYACTLVLPLGVVRILLFHAYPTVIGGTDLPVDVSPENRKVYEESLEALGMLHDRLRPLTGHSVRMDMMAEDILLPDEINQLCKREAVDLVVMGASGKTGLDKWLLGSTAAQVLSASETPVLVVPGETQLGRKIAHIVFSTNLKDITAVPRGALREFINAFGAMLHVVNVAPVAEENYDPETKTAITELHTLFDEYHPSFHYIQGDDVAAQLLAFAEQYPHALIITIPRKHQVFYRMLHKSVSREIVSGLRTVPLLSLRAFDKA